MECWTSPRLQRWSSRGARSARARPTRVPPSEQRRRLAGDFRHPFHRLLREPGSGGAISIATGLTDNSASVFENCSAAGSGGGVHTGDGSALTVSTSAFNDCSSQMSGGALYWKTPRRLKTDARRRLFRVSRTAATARLSGDDAASTICAIALAVAVGTQVSGSGLVNSGGGPLAR